MIIKTIMQLLVVGRFQN